jgi:pimeloyl-ACP methyl ester carboxylesterase
LSQITLLSLLLAGLLLTFWVVQWRTGFYSTRYHLQMGSLLLIGVCTLLLAVLTLRDGTFNLALIVLVPLLVYHIGLLTFRVLFDSDNKYRWIHRVNRAIVQYDLPHQRVALRTTDGVYIQALDLTNGHRRSDRAVIVCHGAARSKNTLAVVQTCSILAIHYDVFTFDFRGHMESGGIYRANCDTELDLLAMMAYLSQQGYKHIAIVGWSVGASTALLAAANGSPIEAIVAAAPPPVSLGEYKHIRLLRRAPFMSLPAVGMAAVSRYMRAMPGEALMNTMDFAGRVPPIPILLVHNEYDATLNVEGSMFDALYERLPRTTERMCLEGSGHIFDWPNSYLFWNQMIDWLAVNF